jgi:hypothetical protein
MIQQATRHRQLNQACSLSLPAWRPLSRRAGHRRSASMWALVGFSGGHLRSTAMPCLTAAMPLLWSPIMACQTWVEEVARRWLPAPCSPVRLPRLPALPGLPGAPPPPCPTPPALVPAPTPPHRTPPPLRPSRTGLAGRGCCCWGRPSAGSSQWAPVPPSAASRCWPSQPPSRAAPARWTRLKWREQSWPAARQ